MHTYLDQGIPFLITRQVGELFARCQEVERRFQDTAKAQEAFAADLEARLVQPR
jgi:hypothetical protein